MTTGLCLHAVPVAASSRFRWMGDTTTAEPVRHARAPESGSIDLVIPEDGECEVITESDTVTYLELPASDAAPTGKPPSNRDQTIAMEHDDSS